MPRPPGAVPMPATAAGAHHHLVTVTLQHCLPASRQPPEIVGGFYIYSVSTSQELNKKNGRKLKACLFVFSSKFLPKGAQSITDLQLSLGTWIPHLWSEKNDDMSKVRTKLMDAICLFSSCANVDRCCLRLKARLIREIIVNSSINIDKVLQ